MLVYYPNEILDQTLPFFDFENPVMDPKDLEKLLLETMYTNKGIGLSANQIGISTRVFAMGQYKGDGRAIFNPIILSAENIVEDEEGCLSFPGIYVKIKRPSTIRAKWQNSQGDWIEEIITGYTCKCFLHEYDHLEGLTIKDRASSLKWALAVKKTKKRKFNVRT